MISDRKSSKDEIDEEKSKIKFELNKRKFRIENKNQSLRTALPRDDAGC